MSLQTRITALSTAIAAEANAINSRAGTLASLTTTNKASLVAALNEVNAAILAINAAEINDASSSSLVETWSIDKISATITAAVDGLIDGAPGTLDTLNELAAALNDDAGAVAAILAAQALRVSVDAAQGFDATQKAQGRDNIGAQEAALVGDTDRDFALDFTGALT